MKINIIKNKIEEVINVVDKICVKKADLNILNFFQLKVENKKIFIHATDLEISYQAEIAGRVEAEGEVLLPARQFAQIISSFYADELILEKKGHTLVIKSENSISSVTTLADEEYPLLSEFKKDKYLEIESGIFDENLSHVYPPLKTAELLKPELCGIYLVLNSNNLTLVSTDTLRLTETKIKKQFYDTNAVGENIKILIPKKISQEYLNIKRKPHKIKLYFEPHQITFDLDNQILTTKLIQVDYPDYRRVIPETFLVSLLVLKNDLLNGLKLNRVFLDQNKELKLRLNLQEKILELYSKNELLGETTNTIKLEVKENTLAENEIFEIKFNYDFFLDGVSGVDGEKIFLGLNPVSPEAIKPLLLKSPLEDNFTYIVMPL